LCTGCNKAEPKISTAADPLPGGVVQPKFNQLEMVTTWLTLFGEDRCTQFRVIVVTDPHTNTHQPVHRQDRLYYTAPQQTCSVIHCFTNYNTINICYVIHTSSSLGLGGKVSALVLVLKASVS